MIAMVVYVASVVAANAAFAWIPLVQVAGEMIPPASLVAGSVLVARDFAHRAMPRGVLVGMAAACALSALAASPCVALASGVAFAVSEAVDYAVYRAAGGGMRRRILASSLIAAPLDSALFLALAFGEASIAAVAIMSAAKLAAALAVASVTR